MVKAPEEEHPVKAFGWAARDNSGVLAPFHFSRRETVEKNVKLKILYCGVCHSDLHSVKNETGKVTYPVLPGHEIAGIVAEVGSKVTKVKVGDKVGIGCMAGSCRSCENCANDLENHCPKMVLTYRSKYFDGTPTYGGYSDIIVCDEHFIICWPENMPLDAGCPLLCAGITTYSPMKYFRLDKPGIHLGVVGLGGLGHVAVKFAKAFGAKVTVISTAPHKKEEAIKNLGVDSFLAAANTMDGILDTVSAHHPIQPLLNLLKSNGKLIILGVIPKPLELHVFPLLSARKMVAGSGIGGMKETQEMLDFAAKHNITADVEVIGMDYINQAMERLEKADVKYRFIINIAGTLKDA
ncbi:hypothetical protein BUALT_Bualt03G0151800 [Buddleja alternifolia]|uniref:Enoyl reductase (ER) domain-containing protein n=1 Tax=Buddleja alternifolia TaxID=168488 RepID=A0AAV6Y4R8_9LAMI|nr:hypothetical protein BUALT_Bualt03G0151800 [Buddleja alternifolia]